MLNGLKCEMRSIWDDGQKPGHKATWKSSQGIWIFSWSSWELMVKMGVMWAYLHFERFLYVEIFGIIQNQVLIKALASA